MHNYREASAVPTSFLQKTYDILDNPDLEPIISWNQAGTLFLVKNVTEFCDQVLPVYFKHSNYASFVRQLNMYDFHKVREGTWENAFKHPLFLRGKPELLKEIRRKTSENRDIPTTIVPAHLLSRAECEDISQKLYTLQRKQHQMELQIQSLEDRNAEILEYNKSIFRELCYYKDREQKIERLLMAFASYVQSAGSRRTSDIDVSELLMGIGLQQRPPMIMDSEDRTLFDFPVSEDEDQPSKRTKHSEDPPSSLQPALPEDFQVNEDEIDHLLGSPC